MTEKEFEKMWKNWLVDIEKTGADIAKDLGTSQQNFNKKIRNQTIRFIELANIFEKYGYRLELVKDEKQQRYNKKRHKKRPAKWQAFLIVVVVLV